MAKSLSLAVTLAATIGCSTTDDTDAGVQYELPQILPERSPICLDGVVAGGPGLTGNSSFRNDGRQTLIISSTTIAEDAKAYYRLNAIQPTTVESRDSAFVQFTYAPKEPGWHTAFLRLVSNAQNFPNLNILMLGRAEPPGVDGGAWDAGPKPAVARGTDGIYACDPIATGGGDR